MLNRLDLSGYNLSGVQLLGAFLGQTQLIGANLSSVTATNAAFEDADSSAANMSGSNFSRSNFSRANLYHVNLTYTYLFGTTFKQVNLNEADLDESMLSEADLSFASLERATLVRANLTRVNFSFARLAHADLRDANLNAAYLANSNLQGAYLSHAFLTGVNFTDASLHQAHLDNANLKRAIFVGTDLTQADLSDSFIHGISSWNVQLEGTIQQNLIITSRNETEVTVDNLEVAQLIYLLLNNQNIRDVIDTIGQKGVLILGRFSDERKLVLDALREKLRILKFLPIVFDFERSTERDFTETILTLAGLSCFIIADITNPKSTPLELQATVPNYMIPFVPIIQEGEEPFSMFQDLKGKYDWVLDILKYDTPFNLINGLERAVVKPALEMRDVLLSKRMEQLRMRHIGDYL